MTKEGFNENAECKNLSPVAQFAEKFGIEGMAVDYKFPDELTADEFEKGFSALFDDVKDKSNASDLCRKGWNNLVDLNPELKKVNVDLDSVKKIKDAIVYGVCADRNIDDMNYIVYEDRIDKKLRQREDVRCKITTWVLEKTDDDAVLVYMPRALSLCSVATLVSIKTQLENPKVESKLAPEI